LYNRGRKRFNLIVPAQNGKKITKFVRTQQGESLTLFSFVRNAVARNVLELELLCSAYKPKLPLSLPLLPDKPHNPLLRP
jgi:hypothetical protein